LLDLCSPTEREQIEAEYFGDEEAFEQMLTAEDDLIDAYAHGELSAEERKRFEKHFLSSSRGQDRARFARAFAAAVFPTRPLETKPRHPLLNIFRGNSRALRIATVAAAIMLVAVLSWLYIERDKLSNDERQLRAEHVDFNKPALVSPTRVNPPPARITEPSARVAKPLSPFVTSWQRKPRATKSQPASDWPHQTLKSEEDRSLDKRPKSQTEQVINRQDATLASTFENKVITQFPLEARDAPALLTLQPGMPRPGYVSPRLSSSARSTITVSRTLQSISLLLDLDRPAQHRQYRAAIETTDRRPVTLIYSDGPSNLTSDTVYLNGLASDLLPPGDYALFLAGKQPDGSFVRVAEYSFRVVRK
jgi:hypothetical protein